MEYSVANVVANGWPNIEDYDNPLYWVRCESSLSALGFNKKVNNQLVLYLQGQVSTHNLSIKIVKLKETWTENNFKDIQFIFNPDIMYISCHFPKEVADCFTKGISSVKEKYQKYGEHDLYTKNYKAGEVPVGWSNE